MTEKKQNSPITYQPTSESATLLFLSLPFLAPTIRPFAELMFHFIEISHLMKQISKNHLSSTLFSSPMITDKDGLLYTLKQGCPEKYHYFFDLLTQMSQMMQVYKTYQELAPLLQNLNGFSNNDMDMGQLFSMASGLSSFMEASSISNTPSTSEFQEDTPICEIDSSTPTETENATFEETNGYEDLLALLSPEQRELYENLRTLF